jgi:hypothetical protein
VIKQVAEGVVATVFGAVSVIRGGRSLHTRGRAFRVRVLVEPEPPGLRGVPLFARPRELEGVVRLSRSIGLPESLPDLYGAALRIRDAHGRGEHQDLMFVTGGEGAVARHLLSFTRDYGGRTLSTVLPYRIGGRLWVFLLRAEAKDGLGTLDDVTRAAREGRLAFRLAIAPGGGGRPVRLARIEVGEPLDEHAEWELRFDTAHAGGGIEPAGFPNNLRPAAYHASQAAR